MLIVKLVWMLPLHYYIYPGIARASALLSDKLPLYFMINSSRSKVHAIWSEEKLGTLVTAGNFLSILFPAICHFYTNAPFT